MIYFIQEGSNVIGKGRIKIGWSRTPLSRLAALQTGNPDPLYLVWTCGINDERYYHGWFSDYRIGTSEWFWPGEKLVDVLKNSYRAEIMRQHGDESDCIDGTIECRVQPEWAAAMAQDWKGYKGRRG